MQRKEPVNTQSLPYFPNLDGLRFFGFLIVFCSHGFIGTTGLFTQFNYRAAVGLDLFFVMSAFLITHILLLEKDRNGTISLRRFFYRRSLRVWPLYFAMVFAGFGFHAFWSSIGHSLEELPPLWTFLTFTMNFWILENGESFLFFMIFLWSVCLEEQFYAVLGVIMRFANRYLVPISCLLIACSIVFRFLYQDEKLQMMYNSLSLGGSFGVGMLTAWAYHRYHAVWSMAYANSRGFWLLVYLLFFLHLIFFSWLYDARPWAFIDRPILWIFMAIIIVGQCLPGKTFLPMGKSEIIRYLGKISYGLYVFHGVFISAFLILPIDFEPLGWYHVVIRPLLILACTILLAAFSYRYFERPFLLWKSRLQGH